jgi:hypothetical protein
MKKNKLFGLFVALFFITIISFVISQETNSLNVYNNITNSQIITNLPYPENCIHWFDGCNECRIYEENQIQCTTAFCEFYEEPKCLQYEDEISLICNDSCFLDGKCYPFGFRKEDKFCSNKGIFIEQFTNEEFCENNFECSSNLCSSEKCVEKSFFRRILTWFKRLF